ncbi:hypothetical protein G8A07_02480 [Roseateles sp. DAIF2]|uniref:hypothetical protein n=1 Tax=Roseateles sp. DAIF2 TaxID=2714952 RepID=UPI0018A31492|nr:hypothetical protein [Roseateles sp. DAIF2]QPF71902.1 hypothetical protein G8A07_02480 [Roseateles sp. DAIF2]
MPTQQTPIQNNVFAVTVAANAAGDGLVFNPDPVKLTKFSNALIVFYLVSPGYYFPTDGSALVINGDDESKEFPIAWYVNAATLALGDYNNTSGSYKYTMTVVNAQTGKKITTDPTIDNDTP